MCLDKIKEEKNERLIYIEFSDIDKNKVIKLCFEFEKKYEDFLNGKNERINKLKYKSLCEKDGEKIINNEFNIIKIQISKSFESEL